MSKQFTTGITYFLQEGRDNLQECLRAAFGAALTHNIERIIIFTAEGVGVSMALEDFCSQPNFSKIKLIAVTFPVGQPFTDAEKKPLAIDISAERRERFRSSGIPIIRAHMPFDPIVPPHRHRGVLGQDLSLVASAFNVFGGSMSLCVQSVVMACDAGEVARGEHVVALTSDTAILAQAAPTRYMLTEFAVREILCKPVLYSIGRGEKPDPAFELQSQTIEGKALKGQIISPEKNDAEE
jgi:hypothetical protein